MARLVFPCSFFLYWYHQNRAQKYFEWITLDPTNLAMSGNINLSKLQFVSFSFSNWL
jgi:hypothetical protein